MFEITPQDIAQLTYEQLRTLVALLCEAELRSRGYPTATITWGGHQNAKDGGLDVRVNLPDSCPIDGFVPRRSTGFQVKKQDMPARDISEEMCPNGVLRPVIGRLAAVEGAYIIVSSQGSTADDALTRRREAMRKATQTCNNSLEVDFYDRTRLASWVRMHSGIIVWVRRAIGRAIQGWEPFDAWAYPDGGIEAEYLCEQKARVRERSNSSNSDLSIEEALAKIRSALQEPRSVVRLVGLSGVGKTRFVQALFDSRIGNGALDPALAVYTNMSSDPDPQPSGLASDLVANSARSILIVDNCPADLHARLSMIARTPRSKLSIVTVEYDIQEDQPEGTETFEIQVASTQLIETLLNRRFPAISQVDARTAAEFSGGNARIAVALADTVCRGGTLAKLNDAQLFERLFIQRQGEDRSLLEVAQACALVYSFNGEDLTEEGELAQIARLANADLNQVYRGIAELIRRDLAQRRGKWRAILPHALANRLAITALENIPVSRINECIVNSPLKRLTISFSRRIGYLNGSSEATAIVHEWLKIDGWIGSCLWDLNEFGKSIFQNCLPVGPDIALRSLEISLPKHNLDTPITTGHYVPQALRSIAWDASYFDRCVAILQVLAIYGEEGLAKEAAQIHASMFQLYLSGTHATPTQRAAIVTRLLHSSSWHERELGIAALRAMLQSMHFSSDYNFQFGAHSRDYGYQPKTFLERSQWYKSALFIAEGVALSASPIADAAKITIATRFRGLWSKAGLRDELEKVFQKIAQQGFWPDGWLALKQTRYFDEKDKASVNYKRLSKLEEMLRPRDLVQRVRGRVFGAKGEIYDVDEANADDPAAFQRAIDLKNEEVISLGGEVANNQDALGTLLTEIVEGRGNLWCFGLGLGRAAKRPRELWDGIVKQFAQMPLGKRGAAALYGMLSELDSREPTLVNELLNDALENEPLAQIFPSLQAAVALTPQAIKRLCKSLTLGKAPINEYLNIRLANFDNAVSAAAVARYLTALSNVPGGESVVIFTLAMLFWHDSRARCATASEIVAVGRTTLKRLEFIRENSGNDYHLCRVVEVCVAGDDGHDTASNVRKFQTRDFGA